MADFEISDDLSFEENLTRFGEHLNTIDPTLANALLPFIDNSSIVNPNQLRAKAFPDLLRAIQDELSE